MNYFKLIRRGVFFLVGYFVVFSILLLFVGVSKVKADDGGYPWSGAVCVATGRVDGRCPNYEWTYQGRTTNPSTTNYFYRNCTDYVAWKLLNNGVESSKVSGLGSAGSWDDNATKKNISISSVPKVGSVGVDERYGHVVYVEGVSGSNLTISEYNWGSTGSYGVRIGTAENLGLSEFIDFKQTSGIQLAFDTYSQGSGVKNAHYLGTNRLTPTQRIYANEYIESFNTKHVLLMQPDGNLVQYGDGFRVIWHSHTYGNPGAYAVFQTDGNLVVYASNGRALWASGVRAGASQFILQDDGHLVTYNSWGRALWWSGVTVSGTPTYLGSSWLGVGSQMYENQYIKSYDGRYSLLMQPDGNLVVYGPGHHALWHSKTYGKPGLRLAIQYDGNLVLYNQNNQPVWYSGMRSNASYIVIQTDGNLVEYSNNYSPLWHTYTFGKI